MKDEWRLLNDTEFLKNQYLDPVGSNEIAEHLPHLKHCHFCWDILPEKLVRSQTWYITENRETCICEKCFNDFREYLNLKSTDGYDVEWN